MRWFWLVVVVLVLCTVGAAQTSSLTGNVVDQAGAAIAKVIVIASDKEGKKLTSITNEEGIYSLTLDAGSYLIELSSPGFLKTRILNYEVPAKMKMRFDVVMDVDLESPTSIYAEIVCDKDGANCRLVDRIGKGSSKPKEIAVEKAPKTKDRAVKP